MSLRCPARLYDIVAGPQPLDSRFLLVRFQDGATWIGSVRHVIRLEAEYMLDHAETYAKEEDDQVNAKEVRRRTLKGWREWCEVNGDPVAAALEERWDYLRLRHVDGPETKVPENDLLWWVTEHDGTVEEATDRPPFVQRRIYPYWIDRRPEHAEDERGRCKASKPVWSRPRCVTTTISM